MIFVCGIRKGSSACGSSMAPKVTRKAAAKRASWNAFSNERSLARRSAVKLLNGLAAELGFRQVPLKSAAGRVEALVRLLEPRCQCGDYPARLATAVADYVGNGGVFSVPVLTAPTASPADAAEDRTDVPGGDAGGTFPVARHRVLDEGFRLESKAFMLTYNSRTFTTETSSLFLKWVKERRRALGARRWAACLEESLHAAPVPAAAGGSAPAVYHGHAYLWWTDGQGLRRRNTDDLVFQGVRPRVDVCTCKAASGRTLKFAATQGLWYMAVFKAGTVESATNYVALRDYVPKAEWYRHLWESHKLSNAMYQTYSEQLRAGHADRKRDLTELDADEQRLAVVEHVAKEQARLAKASALLPMRQFDEVDKFVKVFEDDTLYRRPFLVLVGGTNTGKSVLGADVLRKVGAVLGLSEFLEVTVEDDSFLDLTDLDIRRHAGVLLDGVGDVKTLKPNRGVMQGRPKVCKAGRSPTMRYSSLYTLCRRAVVVTFDLAASNLHLLDTDHWLSDPRNVLQLKLASRAFVDPGVAVAPPPSPSEAMRSWSVHDVVSFAHARDLAGPAAILFASGVNGADLLSATERMLVQDVRLTPFGARKILGARDAFLQGK